jgi:hypothetical protein
MSAQQKKGNTAAKPSNDNSNKPVEKKTAMTRRKGFRMPYISQQIAANQDVESARGHQSAKSVNIVLAQKGGRESEMAKLRHQSTLETYVTTDRKMDPTHQHGASKRIFEEVFEIDGYHDKSLPVGAAGAPLTDYEEHKFEHKVELDFLHHADDLTHMVLELPHGFHPRPTEDATESNDHSNNINRALLGLPGGLAMTPQISKHYFGEQSRGEFFERLHWLSYQKQLIGTGAASESPREAHAEDEQSLGSFATMTTAGHDPGEDLILDMQNPLEEYIPFAARRPKNPDDPDDDDEMPLSRIRHKSRSLLLAYNVEKPPTLEEVLAKEGSVLSAMAANDAANATAAAAAAAAEALARKRALPFNSKERLEARKKGLPLDNRGRIAVPEVFAVERPSTAPGSSVLGTSMINDPSVSSKSTVLKRPLSPKTVAAMARIRNPVELKHMKRETEMRLTSMTSEENITEDPDKLNRIADSEKRQQMEAAERQRVEKIRARLRATIETWQHQAGMKEDDKEAKKVTMVKDKEDLNIKTDHVDVKPVKYVSGTRGQRLAGLGIAKANASTPVEKNASSADNSAANPPAAAIALVAAPAAAVVSSKGPSLTPVKGPSTGLAVGGAGGRNANSTSGLTVDVGSANSFISRAASSRRQNQPNRSGKLAAFSTKEDVMEALAPTSVSIPKGSPNSLAAFKAAANAVSFISSFSPLKHSDSNSISAADSQVFSLQGMLVGPGGVLDESKYGNSTVMHASFDDDHTAPYPRSCGSRVMDHSQASVSYGMETVNMETELRVLAEDSDVTFALPSPRTAYITGCMDAGLNPRASLILRKSFTKKLELQHQGMGDQMACILAESMKSLPFIQSINLMDNKLTDDGLGPLLKAALGIPGLLELNLSQNEIGSVAAEAMFHYLCWDKCPLQKLVLANADVRFSDRSLFSYD